MKKNYEAPEIEITEFEGEAMMTLTMSGEMDWGDNDVYGDGSGTGGAPW